MLNQKEYVLKNFNFDKEVAEMTDDFDCTTGDGL